MNDLDFKLLDIKHQIDLEKTEQEVKNTIEMESYKSCCFEIRSSFFLLISKLIVSIIVLCLCSYQLINDKESEIQTLYSGLIGLILGSYLKN